MNPSKTLSKYLMALLLLLLVLNAQRKYPHIISQVFETDISIDVAGVALLLMMLLFVLFISVLISFICMLKQTD